MAATASPIAAPAPSATATATAPPAPTAPGIPAGFRRLGARLPARLALALRPPDGWLAAALLTLNMIIVVWSVEAADWAPTPSLALTMLLAVALALLLTRIRLWAALLIPAGLLAGVGVIIWQMTASPPDELRIDSAAAFFQRLALWVDAARTNGISIDPLPFAVGLVAAAWVSGFLAGWVFFRCRNFWGVFALGTLGILSNLTFLPDEAGIYLAMYLFTGLMLVGWVQSVRARQRWDAQGRIYDGHLGILTASDTALVAIVALLIAFLLPVGGQWRPANAVYSITRAPLVQWQDDFNRLFAGLPARRPLPYRIWGDTMAFQGTINPTDTPVLTVNSPVPLYWKARSYARYTHEGWLSEGTVLKEPGWQPEYSAPQPPQERFNVTFEVIPSYDSRSLFAGGQAIGASRDVRIETFDSPRYVIDPHRSAADAAADSSLPPALQDAVAGIRAAVSENPNAADPSLAAALPPDTFVLESVTRADDGSVISAVIGEIIPAEPDVLAVRAAGGVADAGQPYQLTASVSAAEPDDLRAAGADYAPWVWSRYTQLPPDLPPRVAQLARQITADATTPYDQAVAIETHLKTAYAYNLSIDPPPFGVDGVDYFLFESQQGYSEYFGSAMTVLMRTLGVPARMTTGYTTGNVDAAGLYQVSDRHSHGWAEVYFPGYGWIPFEPTPGRAIPVAMPPEERPRPEPRPGSADGAGDLPCEIEEDCEELGTPVDTGAIPQTPAALSDWPAVARAALPWAAGVGATLLLLATIAGLLWRWLLATPRDGDPATIYRRLRRLGRLASHPPQPHHTPHQWAAQLAASLPPEPRPDLRRIVNAYARQTYAAPRSASANTDADTNAAAGADIRAAWQAVRFPLLKHALRRREVPP